MGVKRSWAALCALPALQACATVSFAPPHVELVNVAEQKDATKGRCKVSPSKAPIRDGIPGTGQLIDNYILAYRCAAHQLADGRQYFEVPGMLVGLGGAVAAAAGAPAAVALGAGATTAGLNGAKGYYAPKDKLPILAASVDALVCVKRISVGFDPQGSSLLNATATDNSGNALAAAPAGPGSGAQIVIDAVVQYRDMVESTLLAIENVAIQRLSSAGRYAPDAILTELEAVRKRQDDAKAETDAKAPETKQAAEAAAKAATDDAIVQAAERADTETVIALDPAKRAPVKVQSPALSAFAHRNMLDTQGRLNLPPGLIDALKSPGAELSADKNGNPRVVQQSDAEKRQANQAKEMLDAKAGAASRALIYIDQLQPKLDACVIRAKI